MKICFAEFMNRLCPVPTPSWTVLGLEIWIYTAWDRQKKLVSRVYGMHHGTYYLKQEVAGRSSSRHTWSVIRGEIFVTSVVRKIGSSAVHIYLSNIR